MEGLFIELQLKMGEIWNFSIELLPGVAVIDVEKYWTVYMM